MVPIPKGQAVCRASFGTIGVILACLVFLVPLLGLPPTRFGYYNQVESCLITFWGLSGMAGLWFYRFNKRYPRLVSHTLKIPVVWGPFLLGIATLLTASFHTLPLRDFTGSPHMAEGALTFMASGILAGLFSILMRIPAYRKMICAAAFTSGLVVCALTIVGSMESPFPSWRCWRWAPYMFPDFIAFIGISLVALYLYLRLGWQGRKKYACDVVALILFSLVTYYASSKSLGYGVVLSAMTVVGLWIFPPMWKRNLFYVSFFGISFGLTALVIYYDEFSKIVPEPLGFLAHLSTITSRTWLSKVTFADFVADPLSWKWIQNLLIGQGWGTFSNISASNMFLIDQVSLFAGKDYNPTWELVNRDLLHTHNVLTNYFHSLGLVGVGLYLYTQYKLLQSLPKSFFFIGVAFLIAWQVQLLLWFQLMITLPFTLLVLSTLFRQRTPVIRPIWLKPKLMPLFSVFLFVFSGIQATITWGYQKRAGIPSTKESVEELTTASYVRLESYLGGQRQVGLCRYFATTLQKDLKIDPNTLMVQSLKLVRHLATLPPDGNYLANNVALNILSEMASKPERAACFTPDAFSLWEKLAKDHIEIMPYRSDILLPFFNFYQTLGKDQVVLDLTGMICRKNPHDPVGLWFKGSSLLKDPHGFDEGMRTLRQSVEDGIERFMPVPPPLKTKIMTYGKPHESSPSDFPGGFQSPAMAW